MYICIYIYYDVCLLYTVSSITIPRATFRSSPQPFAAPLVLPFFQPWSAASWLQAGAGQHDGLRGRPFALPADTAVKL